MISARPTGQISANMKLDKEAKSSHMVTVTATDPDGASASIDVTIMVTDVDEAPMIEVGGLALSGPRSVRLRRGPHRCGGNLHDLRPGRR